MKWGARPARETVLADDDQSADASVQKDLLGDVAAKPAGDEAGDRADAGRKPGNGGTDTAGTAPAAEGTGPQRHPGQPAESDRPGVHGTEQKAREAPTPLGAATLAPDAENQARLVPPSGDPATAQGGEEDPSPAGSPSDLDDDPLWRIMKGAAKDTVAEPSEADVQSIVQRQGEESAVLRDDLQKYLQQIANSPHVPPEDKRVLSLCVVLAAFSGEMFKQGEKDRPERLKFKLLLGLLEHESIDKFLLSEPLNSLFEEEQFASREKIGGLLGDVETYCKRILMEMRGLVSELYGVERLLEGLPPGSEVFVYNGVAKRFKLETERDNLDQAKGLYQYFSPRADNTAFCLPSVIYFTNLAFTGQPGETKKEFLGQDWRTRSESADVVLNLPPFLLSVGQESGYNPHDKTPEWSDSLPETPPRHDLVFFVGPHVPMRNRSTAEFVDPYITVTPTGYLVLLDLLGVYVADNCAAGFKEVESRGPRLINLHRNQAISSILRSQSIHDPANLRVAILLFIELNYGLKGGSDSLRLRLENFDSKPAAKASERSSWRALKANEQCLGWQYLGDGQTLVQSGDQTNLVWFDAHEKVDLKWYAQQRSRVGRRTCGGVGEAAPARRVAVRLEGVMRWLSCSRLTIPSGLPLWDTVFSPA